MPPIRILVAEDDPHIRQGLIDILAGEGYQAAAAADGEEALRLLAKQAFDLVLLDIMMPRRSGFDVCREIRLQRSSLAVIMLTAKSEEIDKVLGLELGADDYITKPFGVHELRARIAAVLRRTRPSTPHGMDGHERPDTMRIGDALIDRKGYRGRLDEKTFRLTSREMVLLETFFAHPDEVLSRDMLLNQAWGINYQGTTRTLDQHIVQLRKKIEHDPAAPRVIVTVHGVGYRYAAADEGP
jgi:DNA-binding response OmpR family regulator